MKQKRETKRNFRGFKMIHRLPTPEGGGTSHQVSGPAHASVAPTYAGTGVTPEILLCEMAHLIYPVGNSI
jgi:hypothetical protein